tara:strand:- start:2203 stop:3570 length:1368 start_codon:yes stop_codon:yes gene_type:complete
MGMDLWKRALGLSLEKNVYGKGNSKSEFRARVLSKPVEMDGNAGDTGRYKFHGRIMGPNSPHEELYDDPCDPDYIGDRAAADELISWHTEFRSKGITNKPSKGDEVKVILRRKPDPPYSYNLMLGDYIDILITAADMGVSYTENSSGLSAQECADLASAFDAAVNWGLVGGGVVIQPVGGAMEGKIDEKDGIVYFRFAKTTAVLDGSVRPDFVAFFDELVAKGYAYPQLNSTRRSAKHQWLLYTQRLKSNKADKPCTSDHQYGFAVDINVSKGGVSVTSFPSWKKVADIALRHNILWYGYRGTAYDPAHPGSKSSFYAGWRDDPVHFQHMGTRKPKGEANPLDALKKKCRDWFWYNAESGTGTTKTSGGAYDYTKAEVKAWNESFNDNLNYIEPDRLAPPPTSPEDLTAEACSGPNPPSECESDTSDGAIAARNYSDPNTGDMPTDESGETELKP